MYDIPKVKNPEKYVDDVALNTSDFKDNSSGAVGCDEYWLKRGMKPKFDFKDGKAVNLETGEVIDLDSGKAEKPAK